MISRSLSIMVFSILTPNHMALSDGMISTRTICGNSSGFISLGSPCISISNILRLNNHPCNICFVLHSDFIEVTSTPSSSWISFLMVVSKESHFSTFPHGNRYFCHFIL
jgi:hypothetical protein